MRRVQVQLDEAQLAVLRREAEGRRTSVAGVVREAVEAWIAERERSSRSERAVAAVGGFHSGLGDLAERHDDYVNESSDG